MTSSSPTVCLKIGIVWALSACSGNGVEPSELATSSAVSALKRASYAQALRRSDGPNAQAYPRWVDQKQRPMYPTHPTSSTYPTHPSRCYASKPALLSDDVLKRLAEAIESLRTTTRIPGASVALVECGKIRYEAGFGLRDLETKQPVTPHTVFRVGSTTKAMTSTLIATWVDEGQLEFDTRAVDVDPAFELPTPELTESVTVGQLMGMGTGLDEALPFWWEDSTAQDLLRSLATLPIASSPGVFLYNNFVYASAGYVGLIAAGTHRPSVAAYAHAIEQRLFRPLGMHPAAISDLPSSVSPNHAQSYGISLAHGMNYEDPLPLFPIGGLGPAGSAVTSAEGLARFVMMQLNHGVAPNGTRIVSEKNLLRTQLPQTPVPAGAAGELDYAMGWVIQNNAGVQTVWHNGGIDAFGTLMWTVPEAGLGLVVLANGYYASEFYTAVQETLMRLVYGSSNLDPDDILAMYRASDAELVSLADTISEQPPLDAETVKPYLGKYEHQLRLEFDSVHHELLLTAPGLRCVLASIEGLTGKPRSFVIANGGSFMLQVVSLVAGENGPELAFLDSETYAPVVVLKKLHWSR
ncbi:MAG TPA: serine hydrolase domain-containing protein [Polyangiaceae bacterium]